MEKQIIYWTTKTGVKIDIDQMTIDHLRNTLKMIVKQNHLVSKTCPTNINEAYVLEDIEIESDLGRIENYTKNKSIAFSDAEIEALTHKTKYQLENEENMWK